MSDENSSSTYTVLNVMGPYREPREQAFSFDYSVGRPHWATPQGVRVKVAITEELEYFKVTVLGINGGSVGQQLRVNQMLSREIADQKLELGSQDGMFDDRRDVMIGFFVDELEHLSPLLQRWMESQKDRVREDIRGKAGI